jgi:type IV pilus assembly protein PilA
MLTAIKQRLERDEEQGFTLIELMVVLLIIAILLAIAIPTFLGARNTANARSTQENLRNSLTAEQTNWTSNQLFSTNLSATEPSLTWEAAAPGAAQKGAADVFATTYAETSTGVGNLTVAASTATDADGVSLVGYAKDNNCYAIYQSDNASWDFTGYQEFTPTAGTCAAPTPPTAALTSGSAANNIGKWATSF